MLEESEESEEEIYMEKIGGPRLTEQLINILLYCTVIVSVTVLYSNYNCNCKCNIVYCNI